MQRCFFIAICALFAACNPYERDIKHWEQLVEQAERIELSAPSAAYLLLDSVEYPVLLSDEWLTRYCVLVCQLADSIHVPLPHEDELQQNDLRRPHKTSIAIRAGQARISLSSRY